MICYLDSNVLISYLDAKAEFHQPAADLMLDLIHQGAKMMISPLVLDEVFYVVQHQLKMRLENESELWSILNQQLEVILGFADLEVVVTPATANFQRQALAAMKNYKLAPRDAYHLCTAQHHSATHIATFDHDFDPIFNSGEIDQFKA